MSLCGVTLESGQHQLVRHEPTALREGARRGLSKTTLNSVFAWIIDLWLIHTTSTKPTIDPVAIVAVEFCVPHPASVESQPVGRQHPRAGHQETRKVAVSPEWQR